MAGHDDGDDFFSDDDLDALPENAYDELERHAIRQTQATQLIKGPPSSNYGDEFEDEDLDDAEVFDAAQGAPLRKGLAQPPESDAVAGRDLLGPSRYGRQRDLKSITGRPLQKEWPPTSSSTTLGPLEGLQQDELLLRVQGGASARRVISMPAGQPMIPMQFKHDKGLGKLQASQQDEEGLDSLQSARTMPIEQSGQAGLLGTHSGPLMIATQTQQSIGNAQISEELQSPLRHLALLQVKLDEAHKQQEALRQELNSKVGEVAIVRSKQEKSAKEFERELTATKKLYAERIAQQQKELETAREAQKATATELQFSKQDLLEESERVRNLKRAKEKGKGNADDLTSTPKKKKTYRDGFDDDEIQIISPSKFSRKSNPSTPTKAAGKRKRRTPDSPSISLEISHEEPPQNHIILAPIAIIDDLLLEKIRKPDDRLSFLEVMCDHRPKRDHLRTLEAFASLAFPSATSESFASIVLGRLSTINQKKSSAEFAIEFCELLISLWIRCLDEKYYNPIYFLVDLVTFALELKTLVIAPFVIDSLLKVAQETCDLVAIPRFNREPCTQFEGVIDVSACLAVIHLAALGCMGDQEHTTRFWKCIRLDFVLMMLSQHQPPKDFDMTLQLLSISIMKDSIGPKASDQDEQQKQVGYIIDRTSLLLISSPSAPKGEPKHHPSIVSNLRIQILQTFDAFCQTAWGTEALALHKFAIGRLVKLMSDELDALYDHRSRHQQSARIVCLTTRLLHHLVMKHDKSISMQKKLSEILGGNQKYLISLARLNFSEDDLVLDADIDPEIAECAHELLELAVTPEEGDAIHAAFSSQ